MNKVIDLRSALELLRSTPGQLIETDVPVDPKAELCGVYRYVGAGVEPGFKSLAMGLILQDDTRTLTDQDAESAVERVVSALAREHGARIRG